MSHVRIEEMLTESGLAREEMLDVVDLLQPLENLVEHAPAPSAELAALIGPEQPSAHARPTSLFGGRSSAVASALVLALSGVGATGLSAAANTLPRPLQHRVSQFSHDYLPFDLPEPPATPRRPHPSPISLPGLPSASAGHGADDTATRSIPGRDGDDLASTGSADSSAHQGGSAAHSASQPGVPYFSGPSVGPNVGPSAGPSPAPSAAPSYAPESAGPSPTVQPHTMAAPTPSSAPHDHGGKHHENPGDGKGKGDKGPGKGGGKGGDTGGDTGGGKGSTGPQPGVTHPGHTPVPTTPADPAPAPPHTDPPPVPAPIVPLPDPLPGLGGLIDTGPADTGSASGN
jgi:hypothetical protein